MTYSIFRLFCNLFNLCCINLCKAAKHWDSFLSDCTYADGPMQSHRLQLLHMPMWGTYLLRPRAYRAIAWVKVYTILKDGSSVDTSQHLFSDVGWHTKSLKSSDDNFWRLLLVQLFQCTSLEARPLKVVVRQKESLLRTRKYIPREV